MGVIIAQEKGAVLVRGREMCTDLQTGLKWRGEIPKS